MPGVPPRALELHAADAVQGLGRDDGPGQGGVATWCSARAAARATRRRCSRSTAPRSAATTSSPARSRRCSTPFGGAFEVKPQRGLKVTELVKSSPNSMLVDNMNATKSGDEATQGFKPLGQADAARAAAHRQVQDRVPRRIEGARSRREAGRPSRRRHAGAARVGSDNSVILVADVDMLADGAAVDVQEVFGRKVVVPSNGNLAFAMGMVEQFAAGDDLISLRSRTARVPPAHRGARARGRGAEAVLRQDPGARGRAAEDHRQAAGAAEGAGRARARRAQILTAEQQAELERFRKTVAETRLAAEGSAQEPAPGRREPGVLDQAGEHRADAAAGRAGRPAGRVLCAGEGQPYERAASPRSSSCCWSSSAARAALPAPGSAAAAPTTPRRARPHAPQGPQGRRHRRDPHRRAEGHAHPAAQGRALGHRRARRTFRPTWPRCASSCSRRSRSRSARASRSARRTARGSTWTKAERRLSSAAPTASRSRSSSSGKKYFKREVDNPDKARADGRFVALPGEAEAPSISSRDPLAPGDREELRNGSTSSSFQVEKVKTLEVRYPEGGGYRIERGGDNADWKLAGAQARRKARRHQGERGLVFAAACSSSPTWRRRARRRAAGADPVDATTLDGLTYAIRVGKLQGDNYPSASALPARCARTTRMPNGSRKSRSACRARSCFRTTCC